MHHIVIIIVILALVVGGAWWWWTSQTAPVPAIGQPVLRTPPPGAASDQAATISKDVDALQIGDVSADFKAIDADVNSL